MYYYVKYRFTKRLEPGWRWIASPPEIWNDPSSYEMVEGASDPKLAKSGTLEQARWLVEHLRTPHLEVQLVPVMRIFIGQNIRCIS